MPTIYVAESVKQGQTAHVHSDLDLHPRQFYGKFLSTSRYTMPLNQLKPVFNIANNLNLAG